MQIYMHIREILKKFIANCTCTWQKEVYIKKLMKIDLEGTQGNVEYKEILYTVFSLKLKR